MVYVAAGTFTMGSTDADKQAYPEEKPAHQVYLDGYWIYKNDVTVAQYKEYCAATGTEMPYLADGFSNDDHPIVNVSWKDAQAYCAWAGTKLPTEAQWEKAARGMNGQIYPWGNKFDKSKCWTAESDGSQTKPVGSFPYGASPYGCLDMAGNVWQWCSVLDVDYADSPSKNPTGSVCAGGVVRGGSWLNISLYCRCASRRLDAPTSMRVNNVGFRCAEPGQ
jgi:iron(II)-dependent oxidoreductase